jgi:hypothetical protein
MGTSGIVRAAAEKGKWSARTFWSDLVQVAAVWTGGAGGGGATKRTGLCAADPNWLQGNPVLAKCDESRYGEHQDFESASVELCQQIGHWVSLSAVEICKACAAMGLRALVR